MTLMNCLITYTNAVTNEVSKGIAENLADIHEEFDHIKVVEGSDDTDANKAIINDDGATKIHGTDSSRNTISCDQKT